MLHFSGEMLSLEEIRAQIQPMDPQAVEAAKQHWYTVAKPLFALGKLEDAVIQMAGIKGTANYQLKKKGLIIMCADNGVVAEGISQTGQEVTAIVTDNFTKGDSSVAIMCEMTGVDIFPVDIGVARDVPSVTKKEDKIAYGTRDFLLEPAMTREEVLAAINVGIRKVKAAKEAGYDILCTGEMGIGNTTTSSAVLSVLMNKPVEVVTGRGAGLSTEGLNHKIEVIREAIAKHQPDPNDAIDVLSKVGGLDIAGLCGVFLGGAIYHIPVVLDGLISNTAALCAVRLVPEASDYILPSHVSNEPAGRMLLEELGKDPIIFGKMSVGEGTGAVAVLPLFEMALAIYHRLSSFDQMNIDQYEILS